MSSPNDNDNVEDENQSTKKRKASSITITPTLDPGNDEFGILLPRQANKKYDSNKFSELQLSYYKDTIDRSLGRKYHALKIQEKKIPLYMKLFVKSFKLGMYINTMKNLVHFSL